MKTEESVRRMREGRLYLPGDEAILRAQAKCLEALYAYNATQPSETARREALLREMFCEIGARCFVEPPFYANFGGRHVHFGNLKLFPGCREQSLCMRLPPKQELR